MFLLFIHISYDGQLRKVLIQVLIVCSDDNEVNPASKIKSKLSVCHWNLNGLVAHNFIKVFLFQDLLVTYFDICLSEAFLDLSISNEDERIRIERYNLQRLDDPSNKKRPSSYCNIKINNYIHLKIISSYGNHSR